MKSTTLAFWELVNTQCMSLSSGEHAIYLDDSVKNQYIAACDDAYKLCKQRDMHSDVRNLDRHKVASILVTEGLNLEIIKRKDKKCADTENEWFIASQKVLLICAISYLAQEVNALIRDAKTTIKPMRRFILPKAFSCQTYYIDIMCRLLRREMEAGRLSFLLLSNDFFLLEYIAIVSYYGDRAEEVYEILRKPISD